MIGIQIPDWLPCHDFPMQALCECHITHKPWNEGERKPCLKNKCNRPKKERKKQKLFSNVTFLLLFFQDYDDFDLANEDDELEEFLGIPRITPKSTPAYKKDQRWDGHNVNITDCIDTLKQWFREFWFPWPPLKAKFPSWPPYEICVT